MEFEEQFETLLGLKPFPWQRRIYGKFLENEIPPVCDIPTGLGKTSVIPLWLLALAENKNLPRRLVYVVNRRTIVDQASDLVCSIRDTMGKALEDENSKLHKAACTLHAMDPLASNERAPFAVSTLRGEFADNQEWKSSPARPAIIVGTIDMIGSKVLFSGYGDTRRTRPLHAGLLGCDCLFVHDEAHLSPAFGKLLRSVQSFRCISREEPTRLPQMRVLELSATHIEGGGNEDESFVLDDDDKSHTIIKERLTAPKNLFLHSIEKDGKLLQEKTADLAQAFESSSCRVIVFLRSPEDAQKVAVGICEALQENAAQRVSVLTGRIRGRERDLLLEQPGMKPFLTEGTLDQTVFLIATSAAEVGMDLHADHMVCDLSTLDSMVQRLGRVNRFGTCKDTKVHVVYPEDICNKKNPSDLEK
ncbi:MAG: type I-U CRISPR-associated helicase/endonuclease Cas3, partial [Candidatus Hydrogenedentes bacterium]|nr:type I-U CRISPR-associated helicase/endonuclease Cas3 [Candidatus Hydrogenedentota bacterium]